MSGTVQTIFAVLGTVFDMFTTILFYKTCLGSKNIKVNKIVFFTIFIFSYILGLALSQFGYAPAFYVFKSFIIMFGLT